MAFYNDSTDDEKDENSQGMNGDSQQSQTSQPVQLSNQGASTGPAPVGVKTVAPKATPSSGSAPGFQNYTKANQGNAQNKLNSAVATNVANQGQAAKTAINQANTAFGQKVDTGTLANRQNALQDVSNTINAARNVSAAPKAAPATNTGIVPPTTPNSTVPATGNALSGIDQTQQDRFKQVINAQYQGPESLRQAGLYEKTAQKVNTAQDTLNNAKTATGREDLLKGMYNQRADYTSGLNKLDSALLNASKQGVQNLQQTAAQQGNLGQELDKAQIASNNLAQNRTNEINQIRTDARTAFTEGKKAEEKATEDRLTAMTTAPAKDANGNVIMKADGTPLTEWERLPQHFKDIIANKGTANTKVKEDLTKQIQSNPEYIKAQQELATAQAKQQASTIKIFGKAVRIPNAEADAAYASAQAKINSLMAPVSNFDMNSVNLNSAESAILGIDAGEGLYNLGADAIKVGTADKNKLISRDEQARQAALAALAGLDLSKELDTNLKYDKADLAGTQSALDALDLEGTRANLNAAEKGFQDMAEGANLTGYGMKKNKTSGKKYYAEETANLGNLLKSSGYNFDADTKETTGDKNLLKNIAAISDANVNNNANISNEAILNNIKNISNKDVTQDLKGLEGAIDGYHGSLMNFGDGQSLAQNGLDAYGSISGLNALTGALGMGSFGNAVSGLFGGGANSKESKADAALFARQDLERKLQDSLNTSGFQNRTNVMNTNTTNSRLTALQQLLADLDKTNS